MLATAMRFTSITTTSTTTANAAPGPGIDDNVMATTWRHPRESACADKRQWVRRQLEEHCERDTREWFG
jgi:hypothetical protein